MSAAERHFDSAGAGRAALRAAVAAVDHFVAHLPQTSAGIERGLTASWAELVKVLALETAPLLRDCPRCGQVGMRAATRCGHCWAALTELGPVAEDRQVAGGSADS